MSAVTVFKNLNFEIRVALKDNEPFFCLSDVAKALDIENVTDLKNAINREFDKLGRFNLHSFDTGFGVKDFIMINESELYFVIMRSNKESAKTFRLWIVNEVLPSIRKNGFYVEKTSNLSHNLESKFNELLSDLSKKSNEADEFKTKYYKNLELVNSLLLDKLQSFNKNASYSKRLSKDEIDNITSLYKKGLSQAEICRRVGRSDTAVKKAIRSAL
ncbi:BRO domain protein [Campylobacter pinnipediorum subsp. caledonicus]|uniref:BRO family protein n=1 Tax=Campylobacter pinnipediorum TaxID=1965231 RepID=UPI0009959607|nr:BRO family protein [Campylobacter pinnipediorum]AQW85468.1 BRO domain protein [Campylobacter pinnipediorum subsp. caledonicus]